MSSLPPLLVAIPLLTAAVVAGGDHFAPRRLQNVIAGAGSAATCAIGIVLALDTSSGLLVHWFGGWQPRGNVAIGIDFALGPLEASMCALTAGLVLVAIVYSSTYMPEAAKLYDALMLVCCGAMCGFVMSGDIFNLFVWLELMGVAAFALTGFEVRRIGPLQGAINFAVVNTIGGFLVLIGIALVYARTGALNLAQLGRTLAEHPADRLVVIAMALVFAGFLCKAAIVPFHAWLADAYAVAPVPVCLVFAGAMTDIGIVGVARVWFLVFQGSLADEQRLVGDTLLWLGITSALLGGVMALLQRHLKRMLAYSVISHLGIMLAGVGLLSSKALAGTALLLLAHGLLTGGLFLASGVLLVWLESIDELALFGRGVPRRWLAALWFAGAVGLVGPPYVGVYVGHALIDDAAAELGLHWAQPLLWFAGAMSAAALLRAGARIFLGVGTRDDALLSPEPSDDKPPTRDARLSIIGGATTLMIVLGLAVSVVPGLSQRAERGAAIFRDRIGYADTVLHGHRSRPRPSSPVALASSSTETLLESGGATVLALLLAAGGLWRPRLPRVVRDAASHVGMPAIAALRAVHSGVIGDYVVYTVLGTAVLGAVFAFGVR